MGMLLGFVVVVERDEEGYMGAYLCTDENGVPVEFRHTSSVKPNRRQELLYGRTLKPELIGKHIAGTLLKDVEHRPSVILTDQEAVLSGFEGEGVAVIQVVEAGEAGSPEGEDTRRVDTPGGSVTLRCGQADLASLDQLADQLRGIDLLEPLERARNVLEEVHHGAV